MFLENIPISSCWCFEWVSHPLSYSESVAENVYWIFISCVQWPVLFYESLLRKSRIAIICLLRLMEPAEFLTDVPLYSSESKLSYTVWTIGNFTLKFHVLILWILEKRSDRLFFWQGNSFCPSFAASSF